MIHIHKELRVLLTVSVWTTRRQAVLTYLGVQITLKEGIYLLVLSGFVEAEPLQNTSENEYQSQIINDDIIQGACITAQQLGEP